MLSGPNRGNAASLYFLISYRYAAGTSWGQEEHAGTQGHEHLRRPVPVPNVNKFTRLLYPRSRCSCVAPCAQTRLLVFACREMHGRGSAVGAGVLWVLWMWECCGYSHRNYNLTMDVGVLWVLPRMWECCGYFGCLVSLEHPTLARRRMCAARTERLAGQVSVLSPT